MLGKILVWLSFLFLSVTKSTKKILFATMYDNNIDNPNKSNTKKLLLLLLNGCKRVLYKIIRGCTIVVSCSVIIVITLFLFSNIWFNLYYNDTYNNGIHIKSNDFVIAKINANNNIIHQYTTSSSSNNNSNTIDSEINTIIQCHLEYNIIKEKQMYGLQADDYLRSRAYHGNTRRLSIFIEKLQSQTTPVTVVSHGGSISLGHGIYPPDDIYSNTFVNWLNEYYPIKQPTKNNTSNWFGTAQHQLINHARHGADICYVAKYFNFLKVPDNTDMFILEFAVNDYEGQDELLWVDSKTDIFFDGYERILYCGEAVIRKLLTKYPNALIVFIEFRSSIMNRKTAQLLHTGLAQYYQIPIISYDDVIYPKLRNLFKQLDQSDLYSIPKLNNNINNNDNNLQQHDTIQSYPFGCHECVPEHIDYESRFDPCYSVCNFYEYLFNPYADTISTCNPNLLPNNRTPCISAFFAHDEVHPSWYGHQVARDLLIELIAVTTNEICIEKKNSNNQHLLSLSNDTTTTTSTASPNYSRKDYVLESLGVYGSYTILEKQTNFILVQTTSDYDPMDELLSYNYSKGFTLSTGGYGVQGWYSNNINNSNNNNNNKNTNEYIEFVINLPIEQCYIVYISSIKSYANMGNYTISMTDTITNIVTEVDVIGEWDLPISISYDTQINFDDHDDNYNEYGVEDTNKINACTGQCKIVITTHEPTKNQINTDENEAEQHEQQEQQQQNIVKITDLSVRACSTSRKRNQQQQDDISNKNDNEYEDDMVISKNDPGSWILL